MKFIGAMLGAQNKDGGWSNDAARLQSDWSSAAALLALRLLKNGVDDSDGQAFASKMEAACNRAEKFLLENRAEHYSSAAKFVLLVWKGPDYDYERGWPWTPDTFDWVEPSAYALLSLLNSDFAEKERGSRVLAYAEEFLLGLVCKDGGWNFGDRNAVLALNPPDVQSTAITLLALRRRKLDARVLKSLSWLGERREQMESVSETSWAALALGAYGRTIDDMLLRLSQAQDKDGSFSSNILTQAAACLAFEIAVNPDLLDA